MCKGGHLPLTILETLSATSTTAGDGDMPLSINVTVTGGEEVLRKLDAFGAKLTDFKSALTQIGNELTEYYSGPAFDSEGSAFGTPWAQLSPATQAYKSKHFSAYASLPLVATGKMRSSFRSQASSMSLTISNSAPYFKYHQLGTSKLPRRRMLAADDDVKHIVRRVISADLRSKLGVL